MKKAPDSKCQLIVLGRGMKAYRCRNEACGWDAHKRRACRAHMPKALLPKTAAVPAA